MAGVVLAGLCASHASAVTLQTEVVALIGGSVPDGNGQYKDFNFESPPALDQSGRATFRGTLKNTSGGSNDDVGIFRGDGTTVTQIVREGETTPDGDGTFLNFDFSRSVNAADQLAFYGVVRLTSGSPSTYRGIFRSDGTTVTRIARNGQPAPDGDGTLIDVDALNPHFPPDLNDAGQVSFYGEVAGASGAPGDIPGIFRGDGTALTQISRWGQNAPDGDGTFLDFGAPALNSAGQAAFQGVLDNTSAETREGIFRGNGTTLTQIARGGQAAPDGNGIFDNFATYLDQNDAGQVAFFGDLADTSGSPPAYAGIFRGDGTTITQIAREGQTAPDGNGNFSSFHASFALNNAGQVAFSGGLRATSGSNDRSGIFLGDGTTLIQIAREGEPVPDGNGVFAGLSAPGLDNRGRVAFLGELNGTAGGLADNAGIFLGDGTTLIQVVRTGDALLGSTITQIRFNFTGNPIGDRGSRFNDFGQVAYRFILADGREGIAITTVVPEPTACLMLSLAMLGLLIFRRAHTR